MNIQEEFEKTNRKFDCGKIDARVELKHSWKIAKITQYSLSFKFYAPNHDLLRINFSYSNKLNNFQLNDFYFASTGEYNKYIHELNSIEMTNFPRMSLQEAFNFVYSIMSGIKDTLDYNLLYKNYTVIDNIRKLNKDFK